MARLRRPAYTFHTHPETGRRCPSTTPGAVRHRGRSKTWHGTYRKADGTEATVALSEHKETARRMLAELQRAADLESVGLGDPYAAHRARPLAEHVEEYAASLATRATAAHARLVRYRLLAVFAEAGCKDLSQLQASGVEAAIARLKARQDARPPLPPKELFTAAELVKLLGIHEDSLGKAARRLGVKGSGRNQARRYSRQEAQTIRDGMYGMGTSTANAYLAACKAFSRWLTRDRRQREDVLAHLRRQNAEGDVRRRRRALPPEAFGRFVEAAAGGPVREGLTGPQRLVLYTLAANTGLRAQELASLTPESFDWQRLTVTVEARVSKHRREDVLPLRPDVAELLRGYCRDLRPGEPLWPGGWWKDGAEMVQADLRAAGIPYREHGRCFDFHAMRGQFLTLLAAAGVHPKVAQELGRLSSINLVMKHYTQASLLDVRGALDKLPPLPGARPKRKSG